MHSIGQCLPALRIPDAGGCLHRFILNFSWQNLLQEKEFAGWSWYLKVFACYQDR
jgi:hypothetical protein